MKLTILMTRKQMELWKRVMSALQKHSMLELRTILEGKEMKKPTKKQLENLVRNEHISANKLNAQLQSEGWMKYGEFEQRIKDELGINGNKLKELMVEYHYMFTLPFPRFRPVYDNYETWSAEAAVDTKNEYFPTGDSINKGFMEYRMPTVTGHVTKWVSPAGYASIKEVLGCHVEVDTETVDKPQKVQNKDTTPQKSKSLDTSIHSTLWNWLESLNTYDKVIIINVHGVYGKESGNYAAGIMYTGEVGDISIGTAKQPVVEVNIQSYNEWKVIFCKYVKE